MAKLTASKRNTLAKSTFGLPAQRKYPLADKSHAAVAKSYAKRYATPSQRKEIDAKANKVLGLSALKKTVKKTLYGR